MWLSRLEYLSDTFCRLNELNLGLRGLSITVFDVQNKISAMLKQHRGPPRLSEQQLQEYFPVTPKSNSWMRNSFSIQTSNMPESYTVSERESLDSEFFWIQRRGEYPALSPSLWDHISV